MLGDAIDFPTLITRFYVYTHGEVPRRDFCNVYLEEIALESKILFVFARWEIGRLFQIWIYNSENMSVSLESA